MDATRILLAVDSLVNLLLGALLVFFPKPVAVSACQRVRCTRAFSVG